MSFFRVENLGIRFGGVVAVDKVSFEVKRGECYTIIGPNGAGKTTIFNLIGLLYPATSGKIFLDSKELTNMAPHQVADLGIDTDAPLVLGAGQIVPWKRWDLFLEVAARVGRERPEVCFAIAGTDLFGEHADLGGRLREQAKRVPTRQPVRWLGQRDDMPDLYAAADLLLHCADREPLGRVILEAMCAGVPVVAVGAAGPAEVLEDGVTGRLCPPGDVEGLAGAVLGLLGDQEAARALAQKAGEVVRQRFTVEGMARAVEAVYEQLLGPAAGPRPARTAT